MHRLILWAAAALVSIGIATAADIFSQLGTTEASVRESLMAALRSGSISTGMAGKPYHALPAAAQAKLAEASVAWAKTYTASAAFKKEYAGQRSAARPQPTELPDNAAEQRKQLEEMKKSLAAMPPEQRKQMEEVLKEMQKQFEDPEMKKLMADGARMQKEEAARQFQEDLANWNKQFPEDPNVLIARRLQAFLNLSGTVDFDAKLEKKGEQMRFAETRYEEKSGEWKLYYRAGRPAVTAAQAAVRAWLKELPPGK
jgi:hypothetical protein